MDESLREELIKKLKSIQYEWTTLIPRLSPMYRKNAEICRQYTTDVLTALEALSQENDDAKIS